MSKKIILAVFFLVFVLMGFVSASDIQIYALDSSADTTIHNLGIHTLKLSFDRQLKCSVSAQACLGGSCKTIIPKGIPPSLSTDFFFTGFQADYSLTQGYTYSTTLNCQDSIGNSASKIFSFIVADDAGVDATSPQFTIEPNNIPGNWHNSIISTIYEQGYIVLQPYIDEFSKCSYSINSCDSSGSCSRRDGESSSEYVMYYDKTINNLNDGKTHTITLTCTDLSGNSASKSLTVSSGPSSSEGTAPSGGGGGGGGSSSCGDPYTCPDGTQVSYCKLETKFNAPICEVINGGRRCSSASVTSECVCQENPDSLCPAPSGGGGGGAGSTVPVSSGDGGGGGGTGTEVAAENECAGCLLNEKCVLVGYRTKTDYCDVSGNFTVLKVTDDVCDNSFECESNVCVSGKCVSAGLLQRIINWFKNLFG